MASSSSNSINESSGNQNPLAHEGDRLCVNMVKYHIYVATQSRDYGSTQTIPSLESPSPPETPLQIKTLEPPPCVLKGVIKHFSHYPNARVSQNYLIVEDTCHNGTPCYLL
jgi:hypothetical protein